MTRREPHWVKLFLRGLERTGNVRLAAEGAGVDYTTAYQRRKRHGEFAEAWAGVLRERALRQAREQREGDNGAPSACEPSTSAVGADPSTAFGGPPPRSGAARVARPDGKLIKGSRARWSKRAEEAFLTELTVSGSIRRAARAAGFSTTTVHKRRLKDRHFAAAWDGAVETGKARVHSYLVEATTRTFDPDELPIGDEREIPKVSISEAINIAKLKGPSASGPSTSLGTGWDEAADYDEDYLKEVRERILDKLQRLKERDIEEGWTPVQLPELTYSDGSVAEIRVPPGERLVRDEGDLDTSGAGPSRE